MMNVPKTFSLSVPCATIDNVDIILEALKIDGKKITALLSAVESALTRQLDQEHKADIHLWESRPTAERGRMPPWPSEQFFQRLMPTIRDDQGTSYVLDQIAIGGTGTEWQASWRYTPSVPPAARRLEIDVNVDRDTACRHVLDLGG